MFCGVLSALAEPTRLETMRLLVGESEHWVCELMQKRSATLSRMSRHTHVLKSVGLVMDRPDARLSRDRMKPAQAPRARLVEAALGRDLAVREALV